MKATQTIAKTLLKNEKQFTNEFYQRFNLREATFQLKKGVKKTYKFPTFYGDVTCAIAIFMCDYRRAEKLVAENLHEKIKPVKMPKGRSVVAFSCYEYRNVLGVKPYNEIAVAVPIMVNTSFRPPILPLVVPSFKHFGYYIASMPVTSYENTLRGQKIWGLPKVTQRIDIENQGQFSVTTAYEEKGNKPYLTLRIPREGKATAFDVGSNLYSKLDNKLLQSATNFKATFKVNKHMNLLFKKDVQPDQEYLTLGDTKSAKLLHDLRIEKHPFQFRYAEGMSSCFDLANEDTPSWLAELNKSF